MSPLFPCGTETSGGKRPSDTGWVGVKDGLRCVKAAAPSPPPHRRLPELPAAARTQPPRTTSRLNLPRGAERSGARARSATAKGPERGLGGAHAGRSSRARSAASFTCSPPRGLRFRPTTTSRASRFPVPRAPHELEHDLPRYRAAPSNSGARRPAANCPEHALCGPSAATLARRENREPGGPWRPPREVRAAAPSWYAAFYSVWEISPKWDKWTDY